MTVESIIQSATAQVAGALKKASRATGTSFDYLLATARIESNLNPGAKASTSSANGLFQFIEQTWLGTLKDAGPAHGYSRYSDAISYNQGAGRYEVTDPAMRDAVMKLRNDPSASAAMAGAYTKSNASQLSSALGRPPREGELYIAHFLGPEGAGKLISAATHQPGTKAADLFPQAASSNRTIFYDRGGRARNASEVYGILSGKYAAARGPSSAPVQPDKEIAGLILRGTVAPESSSTAAVNDPAGTVQALAKASADAGDDLPPLPDTKPLFQAMFTTRERQPVSGTVNSLWNGNRTAEAQPPANGHRALGFFQESTPNARSLFGSGQ